MAMPRKSSGSNSLGMDIRERTRNLLQYSETPSSHPYLNSRRRRLSGGSTSSSSECSQPSPGSMSSSGSSISCSPSPHPAIRSASDVIVFEKLRNMLPDMIHSKGNGNPFHMLMNIVSDVLEQESSMDYKGDVTASGSTSPSSLSSALSPIVKTEYPQPVPDDLQSVDVSAFRHLICSNPIYIDPRLFY